MYLLLRLFCIAGLCCISQQPHEIFWFLRSGYESDKKIQKSKLPSQSGTGIYRVSQQLHEIFWFLRSGYVSDKIMSNKAKRLSQSGTGEHRQDACAAANNPS